MKLIKIIGYIVEGWTNMLLDLFSDIKYKKYFDARLEICKSCEHNKMGICSKCGCVVKAKTKAEECECPVGKWKSISETLKNKETKNDKE